MPRFAISHHTNHPAKSDHYDLFLEEDKKLKTWSIANVDFSTDLNVIKTPDHRLRYLDYEGEVPKNRGQVKIYDKGEYEVISWEEFAIEVILKGSIIDERIKLTCIEADQWLITRIK